MDCREFNENIFAYSDGTLPSGLQAKFTLHLEKCDTCRQNYNLTLLETELLQEGMDVPEPPPNIAAQVIKAVESDNLAVPVVETASPPTKSGRFLPPKSMYGLVAAAAIILALVAYGPQLFNSSRTELAVNDRSGQVLETESNELGQPDTFQDRGAANNIQNGSPSIPTSAKPAPSTNTAAAPPATSSNKSATGNRSAQELTAPASTSSANPETQSESALDQLRSVPNATIIPGANVSDYSPINIPEGYVLEAIDASGSGRTVYYYANDASDLRFRLELTDVANNGTSVVKVVKFADKTIFAYFSGNMSASELRTIANTITIKSAAQ